MDGKIVYRILAALVLIVAVAGMAYLAFGAGVAHGVGARLPESSGQPGNAPYPYHGVPMYWPAFPFFGLGCFGPLFALLLLFLALRAVSFLFWGPRWCHRRGMHRAWSHNWQEEGGVPPMFREWHERAHGKAADERKD
jgi:hypothetical protein